MNSVYRKVREAFLEGRTTLWSAPLNADGTPGKWTEGESVPLAQVKETIRELRREEKIVEWFGRERAQRFREAILLGTLKTVEQPDGTYLTDFEGAKLLLKSEGTTITILSVTHPTVPVAVGQFFGGVPAAQMNPLTTEEWSEIPPARRPPLVCEEDGCHYNPEWELTSFQPAWSPGRHFLCNGCMEQRVAIAAGGPVVLYPGIGSITLDFAQASMQPATGGIVHAPVPSFFSPPRPSAYDALKSKVEELRAAREPECETCYGTGYHKGFGGPCARGCRPRN